MFQLKMVLRCFRCHPHTHAHTHTRGNVRAHGIHNLTRPNTNMRRECGAEKKIRFKHMYARISLTSYARYISRGHNEYTRHIATCLLLLLKEEKIRGKFFDQINFNSGAMDVMCCHYFCYFCAILYRVLYQ